VLGGIPGTLWRLGAFVSTTRPVDGGKWHLAAAVLVVLAAAVVAYVWAVFYDAKYSVAGAPRQEMYLCATHGPMPLGAVFTLFEEELEYTTPEGTRGRGPIRVCPICYQKALKTARQRQRQMEKEQK
jgi:hypothetical protein